MEELPGDEKERSYVDFPGSPERTKSKCEVAAGDACLMSTTIA
jgi:hypothetical protein